MSFDFSALLSRSKRKPAVESIPEPPPEVIGRRLSESEILELWQERSCIVFEANVELVGWCESNGFTIEQTWHYCELCAAADMSLSFGTYVEAIIRPKVKLDQT